MLAAMRPSEFALWAALWRVDPWGEERADLREALQTTLLANVHRDSKRRSEPFRIEDFMPYSERPEPKKVDALAQMRAWFGHLVKRKE